MDTLVTVVVVLAMIAFAACVIHLLNARHRHQHLPPVHYDHGLAGFDENGRRSGGETGSSSGSGTGSGSSSGR
ncbi:hypothetical protein [Streptomyces sp. ML-6]|uniref:hypothetical protein n=1 Tax=Streptomyces sp. ML-6 TaxID=2982693 RepID=UPI0024BF517D|nr:hypothetical protein [Streptomyces sp. ML-6]MDK0520317.1 hypothetical protein [Streptomyces sp. ML-6]